MSDIEESDLSDVSNELSEGLEDDDQLLSEEEEEEEEVEEYEEDEEDEPELNLVLDPDDEEFDPEPKAYEEDELYEEDDEYEDEFKPSKSKRTLTKKLEKQLKNVVKSKPLRGNKKKKISEDEDDEILPKSKRSRLRTVVDNEDEEEGEEEEGNDSVTGLDQDLLLTDEEEWEMNTGPTKDISRMTERQRSKVLDKTSLDGVSSKYNIDADQNGLLQLSNEPSKRKVFTEEELQLRKAETARKRRNFTEKKLEEEKQDTLNKLLKKRANKVRDIKSLNEEENLSTEAPRRPVLQHRLLLKYTSSKDGMRLAIPQVFGV